ncbi:MAG TPA: glycoside hydrolase family 2 protein, partial [Flavobacterium sp.]|nr:glycoside hydrolase family 2 protein [Flavobacterium sp.]
IQKKLDAKLCLSFYNFSGEKIQEDIQRNVSLKADAVSELFSSEIEKLPKDISNYFLYAKLEITTEKGKTQSYEATQFLDLYKKLDIKEAAIDYTITEKQITELPSDILQMKHSRTSQFFQIDIEVKAPAFFVSLDAASINGLFSDNLLTILPQEKKRLYFIPETKTSLQKFKKMLKVEDLRSSY